VTDTVTRKVAGFLEHHFFATRQREAEIHAAGDYPSQATKANNVQTWTRDNEALLNEDVVLWYTIGVTHVPTPEDYPVMPSARAGFRLLPKAFFDRNPALDVPDTPAIIPASTKQ
jgi:primary-amine oxidase